MPFTFSHPAIVIPLVYLPKRWLSLTGLVVGSLTPDFEYFIRMKIVSDYSHTISGLFWFDLPLGLLLSYIFHHIIRDHLFENLPLSLKSRCYPFKQFNWHQYFKTNWSIVVISILIGAASHVFWDSFTHEHGYMVQQAFWLQNKVYILGNPIPIFKLLQHTSTLLGALVITFTIYKLPAQSIDKTDINVSYWVIVIGLSFIIVSIRLLTGLDPKQYGNLITTVIASGLLSLTITPWLINSNSLKQ